MDWVILYLLFSVATVAIGCLTQVLSDECTTIKDLCILSVLSFIPVFNLIVFIIGVGLILYQVFIERHLKNIDFNKVIIKGRKRK